MKDFFEELAALTRTIDSADALASQFTHRLFEKMQYPQCAFDRDLNVVVANAPYRERIAKPLGKRDLPASLLKIVRECLEKNRCIFTNDPKDLITLRLDDETFSFHPNCLPLYEKDEDEASFVVVMLRDIPDFEIDERIRDNLLSTISHELNTPLTSARVSLYLLSEEQIGPLNDQQRNLIETAKEDLDRQIMAIQTLIKLTQFTQTPSLQKEQDKVSINEKVEHTLLDMKPILDSLDIAPRVNLMDGDPRFLVNSDAFSLVINQMLSSIIKHLDKDQILFIKTERIGDCCQLTFSTVHDGYLDVLPDNLFTSSLYDLDFNAMNADAIGLRIAQEICTGANAQLARIEEPECKGLFVRMPATFEAD